MFIRSSSIISLWNILTVIRRRLHVALRVLRGQSTAYRLRFTGDISVNASRADLLFVECEFRSRHDPDPVITAWNHGVLLPNHFTYVDWTQPRHTNHCVKLNDIDEPGRVVWKDNWICADHCPVARSIEKRAQHTGEG